MRISLILSFIKLLEYIMPELRAFWIVYIEIFFKNIFIIIFVYPKIMGKVILKVVPSDPVVKSILA